MDCIAKDSKGAEILMDYCAGTLDPARAAGIEEHLRECAGCREMVESQGSLWRTLDAWKPIEVSPDFDAKLYARISQQQTAPWLRLKWWRWKPVLPIALAAAALTAVLMVGMPDTKSFFSLPPAPKAEKIAEKINVQEVQQALDDLDLLSPAANPL